MQAAGHVQILADMATEFSEIVEQEADENSLLNNKGTFETSSSNTSLPNSYNYFPRTNLIAQLECVLHMSQYILRIERICSVAKHLPKNTK